MTYRYLVFILLLNVVPWIYAGKSTALYRDLKRSNDWCIGCKIMAEVVDMGLESNFTITELEDALIDACTWYNYPKVDHAVCAGIIPEFGPEVVMIVVGGDIVPAEICELLRFCPRSDKAKEPSTVPLYLPPKPAFLPLNPSKAAPNAQPLRLLQITDIHFDEMYTEGASTICNQPLCCRTNEGTGTQPAGKWGEYECDIPLRTYEATLQAAAALSPPIDAIIWTGDTPSHDVWEESRIGQLNRINTTTTLLRKYFPNTPVFPAIGNHDTFPVDQFSRKPKDDAHYDDFEWLLTGLTETWGSWLDSNGMATLRSGGYYTAVAAPGLRVIALNTQWADSMNFYLLLQEDQQRAMFNWFVATLSAAESAGEKVIVIGHIPSVLGVSADLSPYAQDYVAVSNRFQQTIVGHFYGHTHNDEYSVISQGGNATGMVYIAPSVTTFTFHNPSFRVYELDPQSFQVTDYTQYISNITQANIDDGLTWEVEYSAKKEYGLPDLSPTSWWNLASSFETNNNLLQVWYRNKYTQVWPTITCDINCKKDAICSSQTATPDAYDACMG